jgi:hypothetical protein
VEKKARGYQAFLTRSCSTAPMEDVESSVTSAVVQVARMDRGVPVVWRVTNSPCTFEGLVDLRCPRGGEKALDFGSGEDVVKWCLV